MQLPPDLPRLPQRHSDGHKGDYGRVALVGGASGMSGAISLAGMAALRSGAGLVTVAAPDVSIATVAAHSPCYMTVPLASDTAGKIAGAAKEAIARLLAGKSCGVWGPGLGRSPSSDALTADVFANAELPMVFDADGLNALSELQIDLAHHAAARILTPHPGEFGRLTGIGCVSRHDACRAAIGLAQKNSIVVVLKGAGTIVTDGVRVYENPTGNPGMATGGSGDVLTGVVSALVAQGMMPFEASCLAVFAHGLAGDLAADALGQVGLVASDLVDFLPQAWRRLE